MHEHRFFTPAPLEAGQRLTLPAEESRHIARVLRFAAGDVITLTDGRGQLARGRLVDVLRETVEVEIERVREAEPPPPPRIHLLVPWMKQPARLEMIVEKAMELGVAQMTVFNAPASSAKRLDRWQRIVIAAAKQSGAAWLMEVEAGGGPALQSADDGSARFLLSERATVAPLRVALAKVVPSRCQVAVGPEEGFSEAEEQAALEGGWQRVSLGPRRLRTETAAIAAVAAVRALCDPSS